MTNRKTSSDSAAALIQSLFIFTLTLAGCSADLQDPAPAAGGSGGSAAASGAGSITGGAVGNAGAAGGANAGSSAGGASGGSGSGTAGAPTGGVGATAGVPSGGGAANGGGANGGSAGSTSGAGGAAAGGGAPSGGAAGVGAVGGTGSGGAPGGCRPDCGTHKWACWPMPNPASTTLPNRASYTDLGDSVRDNVTCLEWQQTAPSGTYTWDQAIAYCDGLALAGTSDWRLPTRIELTSIVDYTQAPAIDRTAFPGAAGAFHKTSSDWILTIRQAGAGAGRDFAWAFNVSDGIVSNAYSKATAAALRCVRGNGTGEAPSARAVAPPNQYTVIATGEARDNYTGLIWQQGYSTATMSFAQAGTYCATLGLNGQTWRLPSVRELATLVDEALVAPSINGTVFPNTQYGARTNNWYWASHASRSNAAAAWALNFDDGFTGFNAGASGAWNGFTAGWARCVR